MVVIDPAKQGITTMTDSSHLSLHAAAHRLHVPVRILRNAIRAGKLPAPGSMGATAPVSDEWFASVETAVAATPAALRRGPSEAVPAFARYEGTSAWRKYSNRVREYNNFRAAMA